MFKSRYFIVLRQGVFAGWQICEHAQSIWRSQLPSDMTEETLQQRYVEDTEKIILLTIPLHEALRLKLSILRLETNVLYSMTETLFRKYVCVCIYRCICTPEEKNQKGYTSNKK